MKTVIEMAREAGYMKTIHGGAEVSMASMDCLERFAELVRAEAIADEREACAKVCETEWSKACEGEDMRLGIKLFGVRYVLKVFFPSGRYVKWLPAIFLAKVGPATTPKEKT